MADKNPLAKPEPVLSIFDRHKLKSNLSNRIMRALKDACDDDMRKQILAEVSQMNQLMQGGSQ